MRIILLGPPGAGKGTQGVLLSQRFRVVYLASGDLLREAAKRESSLGLELARLMKSGALVPDELVTELILERLARLGKSDSFVLDGFPRTENQARILDQRLGTNGQVPIDLVVDFEMSEEKIIERLAGRRVCKVCGAIYHLKKLPPQRPEVCDRCGGELMVRADDQPDIIRKRLEVYHRQTEPLLNFYRSQGKLRPLSGDLEIEEQFRQLVELLQQERLMA